MIVRSNINQPNQPIQQVAFSHNHLKNDHFRRSNFIIVCIYCVFTLLMYRIGMLLGFCFLHFVFEAIRLSVDDRNVLNRSNGYTVSLFHSCALMLVYVNG